GEINWDCPCLGGMAHGPCGLQFREAFWWFVFSEADPKPEGHRLCGEVQGHAGVGAAERNKRRFFFLFVSCFVLQGFLCAPLCDRHHERRR
ncbi:hypothetical protein LXA43DRAFT_893927, partial [Ganoderma leucocontextum]